MQGMLGSASTIGVATLPRCESTDNGKQSAAGAMYDQYQASIFLSAFTPSGPSDETLQALNTNCVTGSCEWPTFSSLALCSNTTDMTSQLEKTYNEDGTLNKLMLPNSLEISGIIQGTTYANGSSQLPTVNYNNWSYDPVARFSIMYYHLDDSHFHAAEGIMYWCIQAYNAVVKNGILESEITSTWYPKELDTSTLPINLTPPAETWKDLGITQTTDFTIGFLEIGASVGADDTSLAFIGRSLDWTYSSAFPSNQLKAISLLIVESFSDFFTYLAGSMTNRLRGSVCQKTVEGKMNLETVLRVQWLYLFLPIIATSLACVLLAAVMWQSRHHDLGIWKTSILVHLFHGLSNDLRSTHDTSHLYKVSEMEDKAKQVLVYLKGDKKDYDGLMLEQ
jgi:hypothetical protein